jgi:hypothetical protein
MAVGRRDLAVRTGARRAPGEVELDAVVPLAPGFWQAFLLIGSLLWSAITLRAITGTRPAETAAGQWTAARLAGFLVLVGYGERRPVIRL